MQANRSLKQAKKLAVGVIGSTILIIGLVLLVMPGPGLLVIIVGLGILASEFVWAKNLREKAKNHYQKTKNSIKSKTTKDKLKGEIVYGRTNKHHG